MTSGNYPCAVTIPTSPSHDRTQFFADHMITCLHFEYRSSMFEALKVAQRPATENGTRHFEFGAKSPFPPIPAPRNSSNFSSVGAGSASPRSLSLY